MPLIPFAALKQELRLQEEGESAKLDITYAELLGIISKLVAAIPVDETWYLATYPDVAQAVDAGDFPSATSHFVTHGYFEGRQPSLVKVDEEWYLKTYPDVKIAIKRGRFASAQDHYDRHGAAEGRQPMPSSPSFS